MRVTPCTGFLLPNELPHARDLVGVRCRAFALHHRPNIFSTCRGATAAQTRPTWLNPPWPRRLAWATQMADYIRIRLSPTGGPIARPVSQQENLATARTPARSVAVRESDRAGTENRR